MADSIDQQIRDAEACIRRNLDQRRVEGFDVQGLLTLPDKNNPQQWDYSCIEISDVDTGCNLRTKVFELYPHFNIAIYRSEARGSFLQFAKNKRVDDLYVLVEQLGYDILQESRLTRERLNTFLAHAASAPPAKKHI